MASTTETSMPLMGFLSQRERGNGAADNRPVAIQTCRMTSICVRPRTFYPHVASHAEPDRSVEKVPEGELSLSGEPECLSLIHSIAEEMQHARKAPTVLLLRQAERRRASALSFLPGMNARGFLKGNRVKEMLTAFSVLMRLFLAFACGWLFAFLAAHNTWDGGGGFLLFALPLFLGIAAAFTVDSRNKHLIALAIGTGLFVVLGAYVYWGPITASEDAREIADCAHRYCHVAGIGMALLNIAMLYSAVLVLIGAAVMGLIIKALERVRQKKATRWDFRH